MSKNGNVAVVAGASGAVGSALLPRLLPCYGRVIALTRRPLQMSAANLEEVGPRFDAMDAVLPTSQFSSSHVFCALGTTLKRAGSREAFRQVDLEYVVALGRWAVRAGAEAFVVISAVGADARGSSFYSRVKGEMEAALRGLALKRLVVVRPSLLRVERAELRAAEWLALQITRPFERIIPAVVRPVGVDDVAAAMLLAVDGPESLVVLENSQVHGASGRLGKDSRRR
jgi:uncharacterized protein YbjT (DUF2867 family)